MATQTSADTRPSTRSEVHQLREAVTTMDSLSQEAFSEIASLAKMALALLEHSDAHLHLFDIGNALAAIRSKADDIKNCINCEADGVDASYVDAARLRRFSVTSQIRKTLHTGA